MNQQLKSSLKWAIFGGLIGIPAGLLMIDNSIILHFINRLDFLGSNRIPESYGAIIYLFKVPIFLAVDFFVMSFLIDIIFLKVKERIPFKKYFLIKVLIMLAIIFMVSGVPGIIDLIKAKQIENFQSVLMSGNPYNVECQKIFNAKDRDLCYSYLGDCEKVAGSFEKRNCQNRKAEQDRSGATLMKNCVLTEGYENKKTCFLNIMKMPGIAEYNKNGSICFSFNQNKDNENACFFAIAVLSNNQDLCRNMQPYRQKDCFDNFYNKLNQ